ncbi:beta-lactamase-like protein [Pavlovales sp. CCMP2436]|nr:beta-lactamase-like protein [Pavlovales sp. CCMP2436]
MKAEQPLAQPHSPIPFPPTRVMSMALRAARFLALILALARCAAEQSPPPTRPQDGPARLTFLGTGASTALPDLRCMVDGATNGACKTCTRAARGPADRNFRGNVCLLISVLGGDGGTAEILIDCGKTFRSAVLRFFQRLSVKGIDAILLTHDHADAILGLDEIRSVQKWDPVARRACATVVACSYRTFEHCQGAFPYLMPPSKELKLKRFVSQLDWRPFENGESFEVCGVRFDTLPVEHGAGYICTGYAWGPDHAKIILLTDYTTVGPKVMAQLRHWSTGGRRIAVLVLDALARDNPPRVHASLEQSLQLARELRPVATRFVGMSHGIEHYATNRELRKVHAAEGLDVQLAHDGLQMRIDLGI